MKMFAEQTGTNNLTYFEVLMGAGSQLEAGLARLCALRVFASRRNSDRRMWYNR